MQNGLRAVPLGRFLSSQVEQGQCLRCFQGGRKIFINCLERSQSFLNIKCYTVCYTCRKQKKRTGQRMKFWAYFLIPVYTVLFTRGYNWFTTNFSVIGNFLTEKVIFPVGSSGGKLFLYDTPEYKIPCSAAPNLRQIDSGCTGTVVLCHYDALPSGGIAPQICTAYRICILSAVLVLLYLLWIIRTRYQTEPGAYRPFLYGWGAIVGVSVILLAVAGIISSALEIYVTADIRCHGAASGLQGCRTGGNAGQRWRHIRKSFAEKISGKTPQSSIDIKTDLHIIRLEKTCFSSGYTRIQPQRESIWHRGVMTLSFNIREDFYASI